MHKKDKNSHTMPKPTKDNSQQMAQKLADQVCHATGGKTGNSSGGVKKTGRGGY